MNSEPDPDPLPAAVELQWQVGASADYPSTTQLEQWAAAAIEPMPSEPLLEPLATIRIVDAQEIAAANSQWRDKSQPTNVLSFPADYPAETGIRYYGDVLVCAEIVEAERLAQGKPSDAHWAHIIVHGMLHLQGYDHIDDADARVMEQRETEILAVLGYPNPYLYPFVEVKQN